MLVKSWFREMREQNGRRVILKRSGSKVVLERSGTVMLGRNGSWAQPQRAKAGDARKERPLFLPFRASPHPVGPGFYFSPGPKDRWPGYRATVGHLF